MRDRLAASPRARMAIDVSPPTSTYHSEDRAMPGTDLTIRIGLASVRNAATVEERP